jgi:hypothetical protein
MGECTEAHMFVQHPFYPSTYGEWIQVYSDRQKVAECGMRKWEGVVIGVAVTVNWDSIARNRIELSEQH